MRSNEACIVFKFTQPETLCIGLFQFGAERASFYAQQTSKWGCPQDSDGNYWVYPTSAPNWVTRTPNECKTLIVIPLFHCRPANPVRT